MDLIFILLTQLINETTFTIDFQVNDHMIHRLHLLPQLPPGKTRFAKQSRILRQLRLEYDWKIRVLLDGEFTGIELDPLVVLTYVRVVFRVDHNQVDVLCVHGVRENRCSDYLLRHKYFGFMRNYFWDGRTIVSIDRSDTKLATKLRNLEGHCQEPFVGKSPHVPFVVHKDNENKIKSPQCPSPKRERPMVDPRPLSPPEMGSGGQTIEDSFSMSNAIEKDSFVYGVLFVLAMMICVLMEFL